IYLIDEPSSYLDVKERLNIAKAIREAVSEDIYLVVVEHDLAILDYISDLVHIIYGEPGAYGIVSLPRGVRTGINAYLQGFLKEENLRIRREAITFDLRKEALRFPSKEVFLSWSKLRVSLGTFKLEVLPGEVHRGEVIGILGPNGIGKTTFVRVLAGEIIPEEGYVEKRGSIDISYKPQFISYLRENDITVLSYLREVSDYDISSSHIRSAIIKPLDIERLYKRKMSELSGGELQRIAIASTMLKKAEIYLFDEPMAYLDVEQRFTVAKMIRRICDERESAAFVVEHDLIMQSFIANSIIVFGGEPSENGLANAPMSLRKGMNIFLRDVGITIRRDKETKRPRINREGSWMDRYQKSHGIYYL
ncbi:MAG TPA: ribosome biogenesis/translation initiation ATPase RLI, partial [Thermoprotei archaeon]|nr:ribosome biogenesis/translation initiation ATPase RLI [Thermoprotei archaeon]